MIRPFLLVVLLAAACHSRSASVPPATKEPETGASDRTQASASFSVTVDEDTLVTLPIVVTALTATIVMQPAHGTITMNPSGVDYMPAPNSNGSDAAVFTTDDGTTLTTITVSITIAPVLDPPTAENDDVDATLLAPVTFTNLLANDTQVDGDPLQITSVPSTSIGGALLTLNPEGSVTYDAVGLFAELPEGTPWTDSFSYVVSNGGQNAFATVTVHFEGLNDPPTAITSLRCLSDVHTTTPLVSDPDGTALIVTEQVNTCGGEPHVDASGVLTGVCRARSTSCYIAGRASDGVHNSTILVEILPNAIFVAASATGSNDGSSWLNAVSDLQHALNISNGRDVLVKAETFVLPAALNVGANLRMFGGFTGSEDSIMARGSPQRLTQLTAAVRIAQMDGAEQVLIDGVQFTGGKASDRGAALEILNSQQITIRNSGFDLNTVKTEPGERGFGGAVYISSSFVSVEKTTFYKNSLIADGQNSGGGALFTTSSELALTDCVFQQNEGRARTDILGGAIAGSFGSITATRTHFLGNTLTVSDALDGDDGASARGGAIALDASSFSCSGCVYIEQSVRGGKGGQGVEPGGEGGGGGPAEGAAIWLRNTPLTVVSGIFSANSALGGAGGQAGDGEQFADFTSLKGGPGGDGGHGGRSVGGAVYLTNSPATFDHATFRTNTAVGGAGAKGGRGGQGANNFGPSGDGGDGGRGGNSAPVGGGAVYSQGSHMACLFCSLTENAATIGDFGAPGAAGLPGTSVTSDQGTPGNTGSAGIAATNVGIGGIEGSSVSVTNSALSQNSGAEHNELPSNAQVSHSCVGQVLPGATYLNSNPFILTPPYVSGELFFADANHECLDLADPSVPSALDVSTLSTSLSGAPDAGLPNAGAHYDPAHGNIRPASSGSPGWVTYGTRQPQGCELILYSPYSRHQVDAPGGISNVEWVTFDHGSDATFVCHDRAIAFKLQ